ncbi:MAG: transporter substrate-binding protein [Rhodospirillales bacterium]|nr:transporter substrate-binding protein [Rhodospirillales bacterium]
MSEAGYVEGRNVRIEYRWTGGQADQLPALAAELAARRVSVIVTLGNTQAVRAAKAATSTIPIVFMVGPDPVELGLVASLARPGGNLTGVFNLNQQLAQKWLEVLHAETFALLVKPANPATTERYTAAMQAAAQKLGLRIHVVQASTQRDFDTAFASVREQRAGALAIAADALFVSRVDQLAALSLRHGLPALYPFREFAAAGGLASYGTELADTYRLAGVYTGRLLNGEKPAELPVQQATKVELVLNLRTAKALGMTVPQALLARADEVIE